MPTAVGVQMLRLAQNQHVIGYREEKNNMGTTNIILTEVNFIGYLVGS